MWWSSSLLKVKVEDFLILASSKCDKAAEVE